MSKDNGSYTTSIHLTGAHNAAAYLALKQYPSPNVYLVHPPDSKKELKLLQRMIDELDGNHEVHYAEADPFDTEEVQQVISGLLEGLDEPDKAYVDYTAGANPMAAGAFTAARDHQVPALYVNTRDNRMHWSDGTDEPISVTVSVDRYMKIYGLATEVSADTDEMNLWKEPTEYIFETRNAVKRRAHQYCGDDHDKANREVNRKFELFNHAIDSQFNKVPFKGGTFEELYVEPANDTNSRDEPMFRMILHGREYEAPRTELVAYLAGGWLERWTYLQLQALNLFDDIRANVKTGYQHDKYGSVENYTKNEYDILATKDGHLYQFEIKSGKVRQEDLYKISEIRPASFVNTYLIHGRNIPPHLKEKCVDFGIQPLRISKAEQWGELIKNQSAVLT